MKQILLAWRKGLYPKPKPLSLTRSYWICLSLVILAVIGFCVYFIIYQTARQDAFQTNAEDLAIMDQAIWNILHGTFFHQTVCNVLTDTNCYGLSGISRFAIHFEPILFPVSLLYVFWADPKRYLFFKRLLWRVARFPPSGWHACACGLSGRQCLSPCFISCIRRNCMPRRSISMLRR